MLELIFVDKEELIKSIRALFNDHGAICTKGCIETFVGLLMHKERQMKLTHQFLKEEAEKDIAEHGYEIPVVTDDRIPDNKIYLLDKETADSILESLRPDTVTPNSIEAIDYAWGIEDDASTCGRMFTRKCPRICGYKDIKCARFGIATEELIDKYTREFYNENHPSVVTHKIPKYFGRTKPPSGISYTCPTCNKTSYNPDDVTNKYCGNCHKYENSDNTEDFE